MSRLVAFVLAALVPLSAWGQGPLAGPFRSTDDERRAVLARFHATVPTKEGKFVYPKRPKKDAPPEPDWLAELDKLDQAEPAVADARLIVATLRELAASNTESAAEAILAFAFTIDGLTFRDECGRLLRQMSPHSLPALLRASQRRDVAQGSLARYAIYQLDRLDKARPSYALAAATGDDLEAAMLRAIGEVKHPDAVQAVMARVGSNSLTIRRAARDAWLAYVTGPPPPPAPKRKRKLPGGRLTDEEFPDYLTYRELAVIELDRALTADEVAFDPKEDPAARTKLLFDALDARRASVWQDAMTQAAALAAAKKWDEVAARYDAILAADPSFSRRAEMVDGYVEQGKLALAERAWERALAAFHKAHSIDTAGPRAREAEALVHYARARRLEAAGQPAEPELARALAADPSLASAREAVAGAGRDRARASRGWMLWGGLGAAVLALACAALALVRKR